MHFYRDILSRAWDLTKQRKFLWFFGLFAALIAGNGGEVEIYFKNLRSLTEQTSFLSPGFWLNETSAKIIYKTNTLLTFDSVQDWLLFIVLVVVFLVVVWFVIISQTALIYSAGQYIAKKTNTFQETIKQSQKYFWSIFSLNFFSKILVYGFLLVLAVPWLAIFMQTSEKVWQVMYLIVSFLVLVPFAIVVSFLVKYTAGYVILKGEHLVKAFKLACGLFKKNWLISLEMALIVFVLNLLVSFSVLVFVLILTSPFIILSSLTGILSQSFSTLIFFIALAFLILFFAVILIGAMFSAFQWSAWTILFLELTKGKARAKVARWFKG